MEKKGREKGKSGIFKTFALQVLNKFSEILNLQTSRKTGAGLKLADSNNCSN